MDARENLDEDLYFLTRPAPFHFKADAGFIGSTTTLAEFAVYLKSGYKSTDGDGKVTMLYPAMDNTDTAARNFGLGSAWIDGKTFFELIPAQIQISNKEVKPLVTDNGSTWGMPTTSVSNFKFWKGRRLADYWQSCRDRLVMVRPGLKNLQVETMNRLCADALNKVAGRTLPYRPPYFLFTYPVSRNEYSEAAGANAYTRAPVTTPKRTGSVFPITDIMALDPWRKLFEGIEHQVFLYGEGDSIPAAGSYKWPGGLTMPIAPTVGNIYVHYLQLYLLKIAELVGSGLASLVWNNLDTNTAFAVVYPESANSAQVAAGNYVLYYGSGITYAHPEGSYIGKLMASTGGLDSAELQALARDVAAYANLQRQAWISQNQAIYAKAQQLVASGADIYAVGISQLTESTIVVTNSGGTVTSTGSATEVTAGTGSGNVVTAAPTTGSTFQSQNLTPTGATPLAISSVQYVYSGPPASGATASPSVSVARDTSPSLVSPGMRARTNQATPAPAEAVTTTAAPVTASQESSNVIPAAAALIALLSALS